MLIFRFKCPRASRVCAVVGVMASFSAGYLFAQEAPAHQAVAQKAVLDKLESSSINSEGRSVILLAAQVRNRRDEALLMPMIKASLREAGCGITGEPKLARISSQVSHEVIELFKSAYAATSAPVACSIVNAEVDQSQSPKFPISYRIYIAASDATLLKLNIEYETREREVLSALDTARIISLHSDTPGIHCYRVQCLSEPKSYCVTMVSETFLGESDISYEAEWPTSRKSFLLTLDGFTGSLSEFVLSLTTNHRSECNSRQNCGSSDAVIVDIAQPLFDFTRCLGGR